MQQNAAVLLRISDVRYRRALRRVESMRMNQLLSINAVQSIHIDQCAEINANELLFLPAIRRVRAENDMSASEVGPQIVATSIRRIQQKQSPVPAICLNVDRA
jgi:hypothetical protein